MFDPIYELSKKFLEWLAEFIANLWDYFWGLVWTLITLFFRYPTFFLTLVIVICIIVDLIKQTWYKKKIIDTQLICDSKLGKTIYIVAPIRGGKTTLMAAMCNMFTLIYSQLAHKVIKNTQTKIIEPDYNHVNEIIKAAFDSEIFYAEAANYVMQDNPGLIGKISNDKINLDTKYEQLMLDYTEAYYALLKNNYVYSPRVTPIYNRITSNYSMVLDPKWMRLKDAFDSSEFGLSRYCIIAEDEKGTNQDKKESLYLQNAANDDGTPEFYKLIGNAGCEKMTYVTCNQEAARWVSTERHLMVSNILIQSKEIKRTYLTSVFFLRFLNEILKFFYKIVIFFHFTKVNKELYKNRNNIFKRINQKLVLKDGCLYSKSVLIYHIKHYDNIDNMYKENTDNMKYYDSYDLIFPITFAFGNIDSHIYAKFFDNLQENSHVSIFDVEINRKDFTEEEKSEEMIKMFDRSQKANKKEKNKDSQNMPSKKAQNKAPDNSSPDNDNLSEEDIFNLPRGL